MTRANLAVVARRSEPPDSLDFFPTPPWATRAFLMELVRRRLLVRGESLFDPCCGEGHMAAVLAEFSDQVFAADIFPYGYGAVADFLDDGEKPPADWIVMNPPFNKGLDFVRAALTHPAAKAAIGVAALVRLAFLEGGEVSGRAAFFKEFPPALVLVHCDRVGMHKGRWLPNGSTATAYCWIVWLQPAHRRADTGPLREIGWIGPGAKRAHTLPEDAPRFGAKTAAPLLEEQA